MERTMSRLQIAIALIGLVVAFPGGPANADDSVTYTYYAQGFVRTATYANGTVITYTYDLAGNRLAQTVTCSGSGC